MLLTVLLLLQGMAVFATAPSGILNNGSWDITIDINAGYYADYADIPVWGEYAYGSSGCAWFASARVRELTGKGSTIWSGTAWWNTQGEALGFAKGSTIRAKALACYEHHVSVIEEVRADMVVVSEGGCSGYTDALGVYTPLDTESGYCAIHTSTVAQLEAYSAKRGAFLGYVYFLDVEQSELVPDAATLSVTSADDGVVTLFWTPSEQAVYYTVVIEKKVDDAYANAGGMWQQVDTVCEVQLDSGIYRAYVACCNSYGKTVSNILTFTVGEEYGHSDICPAKGYTDLPAEDNWAHSGIDYCVERGIMNGMSATAFAPDKNMSRAMIVTILARIAGADVMQDTLTKFADVAVDRWYSGAVAWALELGITTGTSDTTFSPEASITRQDLCVLLVRYAQKADITMTADVDDTAFADDTEISAYAKEAVYACRRAGIVNGTEDGAFCPKENATRAAVAKMIAIFCEQ